MQIRSPFSLCTAFLGIALAACQTAELTTSPAEEPGSPGSPGTSSSSSSSSSSGSSGSRGTPTDPTTPTEPSGPTPGLTMSVHTTLGIPEPATVDDPKHALLVKPQYVVSYDSTRKNPRWTSWELTTAWLGSTSRATNFVADPQLSPSIPQPKQSDYTNSGFSRGHLCPSADRTNTVPDNEATFEFTNVVPQTTQSNTGPWEDLEREERDLATAGHHLFIVAGSRYEAESAIGDGVSVPTSMFKVIVVMDGDSPLPSQVTTSTRVIAVDVPNTTSVHGAYTDFITSFGTLEGETGLRFMNDVPSSVHDALASKLDTGTN